MKKFRFLFFFFYLSVVLYFRILEFKNVIGIVNISILVIIVVSVKLIKYLLLL